MNQYWTNKSFVAFDTETTGLDFSEDRIIEAAIAVFVKSQHVWSFNWLLNTKIESKPDAVKVHGITDQERWDTGIDSKEVMLHLAAMFRRMTRYNSPLVVFNSPFDMTMLRREFALTKTAYTLDGLKIIDPLVIDRHYQKNVPVFTAPHMRQISMAARYGLIAPTHRALDDAICAGNIAIAQSLHHAGIRNVPTSQLVEKQERWFEEFAQKVRSFGAKKAISFSLPAWPFGDMEESQENVPELSVT